LAFIVLLASCQSAPPPTTDCASCHAAEVAALATSHHARGQTLAKKLPAGTVGAFTSADTTLTWTGPDGGRTSAPIRYTLGVEPIVQVAVELPNGKLQVPPIGLVDGGWREVPFTLTGPIADWKQPSFNWTSACAPCHATGFEVLTSKSKSLSITCEACHGTSAGHLAWLKSGKPASASHGFTRSLASRTTFAFPGDGGAIARASTPRPDVEGEVCASCHSRRRALTDEGLTSGVFLDQFEPALMTPGLYDERGGVLDEVYEGPSFSMSPMHRAGVRCSDCHDAHSSKLRVQGNGVCAQCHRLETFDTEQHRGATGACATCHLPSKTFLGVHVRHDHFIRTPGRSAKGTLLWLATQAELPEAIFSSEGLVRYGAARALTSVPPAQRVQLGAPLLTDPLRAVRVQAARSLIGLVELPPSLREELETAERVNAARGDAWLNLGSMALATGDRALAEQHWRTGLTVDPHFAPLSINLADLVRGDEGLAMLETAAKSSGPWDTNVAYALGLARWRAKDKQGALAAFRIAARDGAPEHVDALRSALQTLGTP
jgi:predicted CXXCH cytochrome family protein